MKRAGSGVDEFLVDGVCLDPPRLSVFLEPAVFGFADADDFAVLATTWPWFRRHPSVVLRASQDLPYAVGDARQVAGEGGPLV